MSKVFVITRNHGAIVTTPQFTYGEGDDEVVLPAYEVVSIEVVEDE